MNMSIKKASLSKMNRILYLLAKLQRGSVNLSVEARELGFSVRTLQRDILFIEEACFPIAETGPGLYRLAEGFSLAKLPLSARDSALLAIMGEVAQDLGPEWQESFTRLQKAAARPEGKNIYFIKTPEIKGKSNPQVMTRLEQALYQYTYINLCYINKRNQRVWYNHLRPVKIALFGTWYLITLNSENTFMKFTLSQIMDIRLLKEHFTPINIEDKLRTEPNIWFDQEQNIEVTLRVAPEAARYFKETVVFSHQQIKETLADGALILTCKTANFMQLLPQIKQWLPYVKVLAPESLEAQLRADLKAYLH